MGECPVGMRQPPRQCLLGIVTNEGRISSIASQIVEFMRVCLQIEEQRRQGGKMHVLVVFVLDHTEAAIILGKLDRVLRLILEDIAKIELVM